MLASVEQFCFHVFTLENFTHDMLLLTSSDCILSGLSHSNELEIELFGPVNALHSLIAVFWLTVVSPALSE
jgi:hypothetical protein